MLSDEDIAKHKDDLGQAWFNENANGTGPYEFVSWTRGTQIELKRNDKWWGKFPEKPFDRVLDRFVTDGANRARGLEGGEFDLANFVPLDEAICRNKVRWITEGFQTQQGRHWFTEETFRSLLRLRGVESAAPSGYAEAFFCRKVVLGATSGL